MNGYHLTYQVMTGFLFQVPP